MIYFDVDTALIGDSLSMVPFMLHRQRESRRQALVGPKFNQWVWEGLNTEGRLQRADRPPINAEIISLRPTDAWHYCARHGWCWHMADAYFRQAGLSQFAVNPDERFYVPINEFRGSPVPASYVIAPFSVTDHNMNKKWPVERWQDLIAALGPNVWIVGAFDNDCSPFISAGASSLQGASMAFVAATMRRCKCLITIDTGIGHLGTMMNMKNHVMIYSRQVPAKFAETPFGCMVCGNQTSDITVQSVLAAVRSVET